MKNKTKQQKKKGILIVGVILLIGLISFALAGDLLIKPTPKYNISDSYVFEDMVCFKVVGYEGTEPCFNSTEFIDFKDTQSIINFHNRMTNIDQVKIINQEMVEIKDKSCVMNSQCDGVELKGVYQCIDFKCQVYDENKEWADSLTSAKDVRL